MQVFFKLLYYLYSFEEKLKVMSVFIDFFKKNSVFRANELKDFLEGMGHKDLDKSTYVALTYHCKNGALIKIRSGLYAVNNAYLNQSINPLVIAGKATEDAIVAYHSALELHGIAYTNFNSHVFISDQKSREFDFQGQNFRSISNPLKHKEDVDYGVEQAIFNGVEIRRTNLARTVVDVLDRNDLSGGWEEVWRSLDMAVIFDAEFSVAYAIKLGRASLIAKLGYFFDQRPEHLKIDSNLIEKLLIHKPKNPYYMDRNMPKNTGVLIHKWALIVPRYLHEKAWEEPLH